MRGLMLQYLCGRNYAVLVDGVPVEFLRAPHDGIKVRICTFHVGAQTLENSLGTTDASQQRGLPTKETSLLNQVLRMQTSIQGSTEYLESLCTIQALTVCWFAHPAMAVLVPRSTCTSHLACRFQATIFLPRFWLPSLLDLSINSLS